MRIRKRQVPFSLSPVTLSDPNLINRSPVLVQLNDVTTTLPKPSCTHVFTTALDPPQPSDQLLPTNGCDGDSFDESGLWQHKNQTCLVEDKEGGQKGNDTRKGSIFGAEMSTEVFSPSSPSSSKQDLWCEGEKVFPLKKRRGSFDQNKINKNDNNSKKKMKMKSKMKINMNKKCDDSNEEEEEEVVRETKAEVKVGKKKIRGGALMEGSRCSRVNGRGWRCCQPTLVGYSLCEHHLGKGRLRSMTSVRNRSIASATSSAPTNNNLEETVPLSESPLSVEKEAKCDDKDDNEKKPVMVTTKKRMKLGMVKARSISSLLGQTNTTEITISDENNK